MSTISNTISHGILLGISGAYNTPLTVTPTGYIDAGTNAYVNAAVYAAGLADLTLVNQGRIEAAGTLFGVVDANTNGLSVDNSGTITAVAEAVFLAHPGPLTNTGSIISTGTDGVRGGSSQITNSGTGLISGYSAGIRLNAGTVTNSGTITGKSGLVFGNFTNTVTDSGTIAGSAGTAIAFGAGNDLLQFTPSASVDIEGTVDGGGGTDTLEFTSAASAGTLTGAGADFVNFTHGTIDSNASWVFAGTNTIGGTTTLTNSGALVDTSTLSNAGSITGTPGAGRRLLTLGNGAYLSNVTGGVMTTPTHTVIGASGASVTINNAGSIGNAGPSYYAIELTAASTGMITNSGTITSYVGGIYTAGGTVVNSGLVTGNVGFGVGIYSGYLHNLSAGRITGGARVNSGTVVNAGTITDSSGSGLQLISRGTVMNTGTITGSSEFGVYLSLGGTVVDGGKISGPGTAVSFGTTAGSNLLELYAGATLSGVATAAGSGNMLELASSASAGTISALGTSFRGFGAIAVDSGAQWSITGSNSLASSVTLTNSGTLTDAGSLTNSGTVNGNLTLASGASLNNAGMILAASGAGVVATGAATIVNSGTIDPPGPGVYLMAGGTLTNNSAGYIGGGAYGVQINGAAGATITNAGTISGTVGVTVSGSGTAAQTVIDSGTISGSGGIAIAFGAGNDLLKLTPSASLSIQGTVDGGAGTNTLELGSTSSHGTLTGLGTDFVNFSRYTIDGGAYWTFAGTNTIGGAATLTNSGSFVDSGTLTNTGTVKGTGTASGSSFNGLALLSGASFTNAAGGYVGLISADYHAAQPLVYARGAGASVTNLGTLKHAEVGVSLSRGGIIHNGATNDTTAAIDTYDGALSGNTGSVTVSNYGSISSRHIGIGLGGTGYVANGAAGSTTALVAGEAGVVFYGRAGTVKNFGTIMGTTSGPVIYTDGVLMGYGSGGTVVNAGTILGSKYSIYFAPSETPGRYGPDGGNRVVLYPTSYLNNKVNAAGTANVLEFASATGQGTISHFNTGYIGFKTITVDSGSQWRLAGTDTLASGYTLTNSGTLTLPGTLTDKGAFTNDGTLVGSGALVIDPTTLTNAGYLAVETTLADGSELDNTATGTIVVPGTAVYAGGTPATVTNAGTISETGSGGLAVGLFGGGKVANTGLISAGNTGVDIQNTGTVANYGTITGAAGGGGFGVLIYSGAILNGLAGATSALISAQSGDGAVIDYGTLANAGTISANVGIVVRAATIDNSGAVIGAALGVGFGSTHSSTITNYGDISGGTAIGVAPGYGGVATAAQTVIDSGTIVGSGGTAVAFGSGNDRLKLVPSASVLIQGTVDGSSGTNALEFASAPSHGTLTGAGADFVNFGNGTVDSGAYWNLAGTDTIASTTTIANFGTLNVAGTLANAGRISGPGYSLLLSPGAYLDNLNSGTITATGTGTRSNPLVAGLVGGTVRVNNLGTISNSHLGVATGIYLLAGGTVTNGATDNTTALISASLDPIAAYAGPLTVTNFGTIDAPFINDAYGIGVLAGEGGAIVNGAPGSTAALIHGGGDGVLSDDNFTITNFGTIAGNGGTTGIGINLLGGGTITDAGTIAGSSTAISFGVIANQNRLVLESGYKLIGSVIGATGSATNTLELGGANGASAVTVNYNALGLTNFGTVAFAPGNGNYATLRISDTATLPHTIVNFAGIHDTIDLSPLAYVTASSAVHFDTVSSQLTVTNGTSSVALQLGGGSYADTGWKVSNDGFGGTDVYVEHLPPPVTVFLVSDTGASSTDDVTSNPALTGGGDPGATVTITKGVTTLGTTTADNLGHWSFSPPGLADGTQTLTASETNGNGTGTASLAITLDTTAPVVSIASGGTITNQVTQTIAGTISDANLAAIPTITLFDNGTPIGTTTASGGNWSTAITLSGDEAHDITAQATDLAGNTGTSNTDMVILDTTPPATTPAALSVPGNSVPAAIGIAAPTDASAITITVAGLPTDGSILLPDGVTPVTQGETLTTAQLTGLEFAPTPGAFSATSTFSYAVADAAGNSSTGDATLSILHDPTFPRADLTGNGASDLLMLNSNSNEVVVGALSGGALTYGAIGGLGTEWSLDGTGNFLGDGRQGALLFDSISDGIVVDEDVGGTAHYTQIGVVGPEWQFVGNGPFLGQGTDDVLLRDTLTGGLVAGQVSGGTLQYSLLGSLDTQLAFEGTGDYLGDGSDAFLVRDGGTGQLSVGEVVGGSAQLTAVGGVGPEWEFVGSGDLFGDGRADFLIWDGSTGVLCAGEVEDGAAQYTALGGLGPEWQFLGVGQYTGAGATADAGAAEFAIRNTDNGQLMIGVVSGGNVTYTPIGGVGPEWSFPIKPAPFA